MSVITREEVGFLEFNPIEGMAVPGVNVKCMTLRNARAKYKSILGIKVESALEGKEELFDRHFELIFPMYEVLDYPEAKDKKFTFSMSKLSTSSMAELSTSLMRVPWTFVKYEPYRDAGDPIVTKIVSNYPSPITLYTMDAFKELKFTIGATNYYRSAYKSMEGVTISTGLYGIFHMNQIVNLGIEENKSAPDISKRLVKKEQRGILCSGHTAHSAEAGLVRKVAHGNNLRLWSAEEFKIFRNSIATIALEDRVTNFVMVVGNLYSHISRWGVDALKDIQSKGGLSLATLNFIEDGPLTIAYLDIRPGVILKKVGNCYYDSTNLDRTNLVFHDYFSTFFLTVPFIKFDRPPRTLVASCQSIQGICSPLLFQSAIFKPLNPRSSPMVLTKYISDMNLDPTYISGENLKIGLINNNNNYEDCFLLSSAAVERGVFAYKVITSTTVDMHDVKVKVGQDVTMDNSTWWCLPFPAKIIDMQNTNDSRVRLRLERDAVPSDGDKMSTLHGQKGIVRVTPKDEMPCAMDDDGNLIEFDLVIAISSVLSRVTTGQVYELRAGRIVKEMGLESREDASFMKMNCDGVMVPSEEIESVKPSRVYDRKTRLPMVGTDDRKVSCEWGYGRVQLLHHLTAGKHHFTRVENTMNTKYAAKGKSGGGSVKFGDMETEAACSSGLTKCLNEIKSRIDTSVVAVCVSCNRQCMLCDCTGKNNRTRNMIIPFSTVSMDIISSLTVGRSFEYFPTRVEDQIEQ